MRGAQAALSPALGAPLRPAAWHAEQTSLNACSPVDGSAAAEPDAPPAGGASGSAAALPSTGEQAFKEVCSACHAAGLNGAPKAGDKAAWAPRIAQGKDTLYKDAINGKGLMPPRGGTTWPDATIRMTVDYMVSLAK